MQIFAKRTDRQTFFQESAARRGVRDTVIEKDFWVCWALERLCSVPDLADHITFKGGTSLSKAYGLIERFSEDIDLTIGRSAPYIRETENPMGQEISGKERERRIVSVKKAVQEFITQTVLPSLNAAFEESLGTGTGWTLELDQNDKDQQTLLFFYPAVCGYGGFGKDFGSDFQRPSYIRPTVKLEFGARGETEPHEMRTISAYVAEEFPDSFMQGSFKVRTLSAERTFWEKATILHALHHGSTLRDRMSRHYYDVFMMDKGGIAASATGKPDILEQVVRNKETLFRDGKASYGTATMTELKLVPAADREDDLRKDYEAMQEMFMGDFPSFDEIVKKMQSLEERIHSRST